MKKNKKIIVTAAAVILAAICAVLGIKPEEIFEIKSDNNLITENQYEDISETFNNNDLSEIETVEHKNISYKFANQKLLEQHFKKHGVEMGFESAEAYEKAASDVINNPSSLHKNEKEDGDDVYYLQSTNEFVVLSVYGNIRTYFNPDSGIDYFNKQ